MKVLGSDGHRNDKKKQVQEPLIENDAFYADEVILQRVLALWG